MTAQPSQAYTGVPGHNEAFNLIQDTAAVIDGGDGNDYINSFGEDDLLHGGLGRDLIIGQGGDDVIYGDRYAVDEQTGPSDELSAGADAIFGFVGRDLVYAGGGNNFVDAGADDDIVSGGAGKELLQGGVGDDSISAAGGDDKLFGGTDTVSHQSSFLNNNVGLITTNFNGLNDSAADGSYDAIGYLIFVSSNTGSDTLDGGAGNDTIDGGDGIDFLTGGLGYDRFVFACSNTTANADHIADFKHAVDKVVLDHSFYSKLAVGALSASAFKDTASGTVDSNDRILYDHNTGKLFYDADGSGSASAHQFATLDNHPTLTASDFTIVA